MTYSMPPSSYRTLQPEPERRRPRRVWDTVLTIVLLVLLPLVALAATYAGALLAMASDACAAGACDFALLNVGFWTAVVAPWVVLVLGMILTIVLLVRHRIAFWAPLLAIVLMVAMWFVSAAIVGAALA